MPRFNSMWEWYSMSGKQKPPYAALIAHHGGCVVRQKGSSDLHFTLLDDARRHLQLNGWKRMNIDTTLSPQ